MYIIHDFSVVAVIFIVKFLAAVQNLKLTWEFATSNMVARKVTKHSTSSDIQPVQLTIIVFFIVFYLLVFNFFVIVIFVEVFFISKLSALCWLLLLLFSILLRFFFFRVQIPLAFTLFCCCCCCWHCFMAKIFFKP